MVDHEGEAFAISDLCDQMERECEGNVMPYSRKYFNKKLMEHFGENILISQMSGSIDLVMFR